MVIDILRGTPLWVFALFALLVWLGLRQLRTRSVPVSQIWRVPVIFVVWGLLGLLLRNEGAQTSLAPWLAAAIPALLAGLARRNTLPIDRLSGLVTRPGSVLPLLRNLTIFGAHYALNVAAAFYPGRHGILQLDMAISGMFAGYFLGWLVRFVQHSREMPAAELARSPATA